MAGPAGRAAALASISSDIPNIFSSVLSAYRTGTDRKDAKEEKEYERARQEKMDALDIEGKQMGIKTAQMGLDAGGLNLQKQREAISQLKRFEEVMKDEKTRNEAIAGLSKARKQIESGNVPMATELPQTGMIPKSQMGGMGQDEYTVQKLAPYRDIDKQAGAMVGAAEGNIKEGKAFEMDALERERKLSDAAANFERQKELYGIKGEQAVDLATTKAGLTPPKVKKEPTASQFQSASYASRLEQSESVLDKLSGLGFDPSSLKNRIIEKGDLGAIKSPQQRQYAQAMRAFINSNLRRESGAAISAEEFESAKKQYFPQVGDDEDTMNQKREARLLAFAGLKAEAGDAYGMVKQTYKGLTPTTPTTTPAAGTPPTKSNTRDELDDILFGGM